jgi:6-phosphogluconolactonase (cycloisomerase 2 family)
MRYLDAVCLCGSFCAAALLQPALIQAQTTSSHAAYVYVSMTPKNSSVNEIVGYAAAANGSLTVLPGSPYTADVTAMTTNGKYVFGTNVNGLYVDAYHIASNGALSLWEQTDVAKFNAQDCGFSGSLVLDHTGTTRLSR